MTVVVAADLDGTLIYSRRSLGPDAGVPLSCVEVRDGEQVSFMTAEAARTLASIATTATVVPVTTRVPEQYLRVALPGPPPRFAVVANGALLHVDGVADSGWAAHIERILGAVFPFQAVWDYASARCDPRWTTRLRNCGGAFCYAVVDPGAVPHGLLEEVSGWAAQRGWRTSLQGRKLYWIPEALSKRAAVAEAARRAGASLVLAAGDSLLDAELLVAADRAIRPRHGELFERGWSSPGVRCTERSGVLAGQEITSWLAERVAEHGRPG
jgi:hydroxymethylpyrimidine pyrophosphatase-like HAD family hydrolase